VGADEPTWEPPTRATTLAVVPMSPFRSATVTSIGEGVAAATLVEDASAATTRSGRRRTIVRPVKVRVRKETVTLSRSPRTSPFNVGAARPPGDDTDRSARTLRRCPVRE